MGETLTVGTRGQQPKVEGRPESKVVGRQPKVADVEEFRARRRNRNRDAFIANIAEDDVLRLASSYHDGDSCAFFRPPARGSYNTCYFVQFGGQQEAEVVDKWVVRVPLEPCLAQGGRDKLEREVATMQLVAEKTTIPIPKLHAYRLGVADDNRPLASFLILEYVEGEQLDYFKYRALSDEQKHRLFVSLADIYIQLRRLEFPSIGSLVRQPDGGIRIGKQGTSIDMNELELEGARPFRIQASYYGGGGDGLLTSADKYMTMLLDIADNAFVQGQVIVNENSHGEQILYYLDLFRKHVEKWTDHRLDRGPFTLIHGDLYPPNLLVNERHDIVAILDWEWSHVVPRQLFHPPLWLLARRPLSYALSSPSIYTDYLEQLDQLVAIMRIQERERYGNELLSNEWTEAKKDGGFVVAHALQSWQEIHRFCHFTLTGFGRRRETDKRIEAFMQEDPDRQALVARRRAEYEADVDILCRFQDAETSPGKHEGMELGP